MCVSLRGFVFVHIEVCVWLSVCRRLTAAWPSSSSSSVVAVACCRCCCRRRCVWRRLLLVNEPPALSCCQSARQTDRPTAPLPRTQQPNTICVPDTWVEGGGGRGGGWAGGGCVAVGRSRCKVIVTGTGDTGRVIYLCLGFLSG